MRVGFWGRIYLHSLVVVVVLICLVGSTLLRSHPTQDRKNCQCSLPRFLTAFPPSISHRTWKMTWTAFESCTRRTSAKEKEVRTVRLDRAAAQKRTRKEMHSVHSAKTQIIATKRRGNFFSKRKPYRSRHGRDGVARRAPFRDRSPAR